ncbi:hypothetical protein IAR55_001911 [Kwoniella newhampshirensis]|uniref:CCZ1/INTU/HSP4 first Longin domain-containing protein n=1 Tax=Kwoniella newhampshirensis TaxID=1651941 RepID=A0AAW0Z3L0_9TREE
MTSPVSTTVITAPPSVSHFVIFNPTLSLATATSRTDTEERDKDEEDDLKEAAQIVFYTSREAGGVSRDRMLRQVGLAKGLMGFADMLAKDKAKYWSIHAHKSRLLIYSPETDFYIYICITLAHTAEKKDPTPSAQGLSDQMLVDALARGYEDFRLLHGTLASHPPSSTTSSLLDKYFTRFAFSFESTYLTSPPSLSTWICGYPSSSSSSPSIDDVVAPFRQVVNQDCDIYIIGKDGPLYGSTSDQALIRYLLNLVQASLPQLSIATDPSLPRTDTRSSLGFGLLGRGRKKDDLRKASWTTLSLANWVPDIRRTSSPLPDQGKVSDQTAVPPSENTMNDSKGKWGFGLGGLGDVVGSVGTAFGRGGGAPRESVHISKEHSGPKSASSNATEEDVKVSVERDTSGPGVETTRLPASPMPVKPQETVSSVEPNMNASSKEQTDPHHVEQSDVSLPELESAVEPSVDLEWDDRSMWLLSDDDTFQNRTICWIIRDSVLVSVLFPNKPTPPYDLPSTSATLDLFSRLSSTSPMTTQPAHSSISRPSTPDSGSTSANSWLSKLGQGILERQGEFDFASEHTLSELRGTLKSDPMISEIYAKMPASQFVVAKHTAEKELYLHVGRKEASLTDAEQAVRSFARSNPDFGG